MFLTMLFLLLFCVFQKKYERKHHSVFLHANEKRHHKGIPYLLFLLGFCCFFLSFFSINLYIICTSNMQRSANAVITLTQLAKEIVGSCKNSGTSQFQTLYTNPAPINVLAQTLMVTKRLSFVIFFNFFIITNSSSYILFDNNMEKEENKKETQKVSLFQISILFDLKRYGRWVSYALFKYISIFLCSTVNGA